MGKTCFQKKRRMSRTAWRHSWKSTRRGLDSTNAIHKWRSTDFFGRTKFNFGFANRSIQWRRRGQRANAAWTQWRATSAANC
jgi:hypothetical protein